MKRSLILATVGGVIYGGGATVIEKASESSQAYQQHLREGGQSVVKAIDEDGFGMTYNRDYLPFLLRHVQEGESSGDVKELSLVIGRCLVSATAQATWQGDKYGNMNVYDYLVPASPLDSKSSPIVVQNESEVQQLSAYQDCFKLKEATN